MRRRTFKNSQLGILIVVGTLGILTTILVAALGIFFFSNQFNTTEVAGRSLLVNQSPLDTADIDPALALTSLGGVIEAEVINEAINKARPETALAVLLFQPDLMDQESAGAFLRLAPIYAKNGDREKAIYCYQTAGTITTLSPDILHTTRADLFIQIGEGLLMIEATDLAKFYFDQAFTLAAESPFLQVVHRRDIFERLQKNYIVFNERELARTSLNLSANPPDIDFLESEGVILPINEVIPYSAAIQEAEAERWIRAQELAAILVERGGKAPPSAQTALQEALVNEDALKLPYFAEQLETEAQLSRRLDIIGAKIKWLSIKYRVAKGAYGLEIVPEWTEQAEQIRADLTKTYEALFALYADLIIALPQAEQIDKATEERLRREVLLGELGRYPNYPEEQRKRQLLEANENLRETQPELNIFVGIQSINNRDWFTFVGQPVD